MSVVDLHPEQLFDALRAGRLNAGERARLEAHCARCTACMFELRWVEASPGSQLPSAEDCAYGDAAIEKVFRSRTSSGTPYVAAVKPSLGWMLPLAIGGLMLAVGAGLGWFFTRPAQPNVQHPVAAAATLAPQPADAQSASPRQAPAEIQHGSSQHEPAAARPSANQLLAAARRAQSRGEVEHAERLYSQVISEYASTPAGGAAQIALGRLLFERQPFAAVTLFDGYLRRRPSGTLAEEALFYRALSLEKLGESHSASQSLRELLERFPKSLYAEPARARLATSKSVE